MTQSDSNHWRRKFPSCGKAAKKLCIDYSQRGTFSNFASARHYEQVPRMVAAPVLGRIRQECTLFLNQ